MDDETTDLDRTSAEMVGHVDDPEMARRIAAFFSTIVAAATEGRLEYLGILVGVRQPTDEEKLDIYARAVYGDDFTSDALGEVIAAGHAELGQSAEAYDPSEQDPERTLQ